MSERIGLIGAGIMGAAMASRFLAAGHRVTVFDTDADARQRAHQLGCDVANSPAAVGHAAGMILMSLPRAEHVTSAVRGPEGLLRTATAGSLIVDTSTVDPGTTRANSVAAAAIGVGYLDAPVLGRPRGIGAWTLPVGGEEADLRRAEPVLRVIAARVVHVGPSGQGNTLKLLNNLMFGAINAATCKTFALADRLVWTDKPSSTRSQEWRRDGEQPLPQLGPKIITGDFEPQFGVDYLGDRTSASGWRWRGRLGMTLDVGEAGQRLNRRAQAAGHGGKDTAAVVEVAGKAARHSP